MNIKPYDKTIKELLISGRQFTIPRFQREYSWDKKNYQEFFEDMMNCLIIENGKISTDQYFLGTMLFIGNYIEGTDKEIDVVDGQQRLTTITILFSALSDRFLSLSENTLSEQIFRYIMTKDDNGNDIRVLKSKTHYPFFSYYIQDRKKGNLGEPSSEEEICIKETYDYLYNQLDETKMKTLLKKYDTEIVNQLEYLDILKALRDQVLQTTFVSISTADSKQANMIFEILNAKGKKLSYVDLIKNKIFEVLNSTEPADFAVTKWNSIKEILNSRKETVGLATFYRHFWISTYRKSASSKMYDDFNKYIKPHTEERFKIFMNEMENSAKTYIKITNPTREDFENKKQHFWLLQSLNILTNYFNIVQVRIALLALFRLKDKNLIEAKMLKKTVLYLENFHFAFNAVLSSRSNKFETTYASFALEAGKCKDKESAKKVIDNKLIGPLDKIYPGLDEFKLKFVQLTYSKKENSNNMKVKYLINKLNCFYQNEEVFSDMGSIEHILPEAEGEDSLNVGNLIMLETTLNEKADKKSYVDKIVIYQESSYNWIKIFAKETGSWDKTMIADRASQLAEFYYNNILKRN